MPRKAADIPDDVFLAALTDEWQLRWTFAEQHFPGVHPKIVLAKYRQLKKRGLVGGCDCGCRGDWCLASSPKAY
jgi:hypothetical protein